LRHFILLLSQEFWNSKSCFTIKHHNIITLSNHHINCQPSTINYFSEQRTTINTSCLS